MLDPGTRVGRFRVLGELGRGGMGDVFEVEDETGARFAMKSPLRDVDRHGNVTRRFAREANALRMLDHPNLIAAIDVFVEAGQLFLVMEKVDGRPLSQAIAEGPLPPRTALVFARQLLDGVAHAHAAGLVHRDLKPDNILLVARSGWEQIKIIDFGIVKLLGDAAAAFGANALTSTGIVVGTPAYMAPEQALGRTIDGRADVYAIGVILFELLAGRLPFRDPDPLVMMRLHAKVSPPALRDVMRNAAWCTPQLVALVEGALVKEPEDRFPSAVVMIAALDDAFASIDHL
ncbi:MAG: serine/threonine-protein kinase [Kofleriaceae bacterium]